jgi:hypothetical protein
MTGGRQVVGAAVAVLLLVTACSKTGNQTAQRVSDTTDSTDESSSA